MTESYFTADEALERFYQARFAIPVALLTLFWVWETWHPFFGWGTGRLRHGTHNIALALFNVLVLGLPFAAVTAFVADWTTRVGYGLLNWLSLHAFWQFLLAIVLLDGWMYVWHRANHSIPLLWRFHRMHHSDHRMDVTTATRFHVGELAGANLLRLGFIPLLGWQIWHIVVYEMLVIAITQFHHANISLGRLDSWLRRIIVTPDMHKMHHSRWQPETDSNFSTLFSVWDRLARTFRMRCDPKTLHYGLNEFDGPHWQTFWGMLKTPFVSAVQRGTIEDADSDIPASSSGGLSAKIEADLEQDLPRVEALLKSTSQKA